MRLALRNSIDPRLAVRLRIVAMRALPYLLLMLALFGYLLIAISQGWLDG